MKYLIVLCLLASLAQLNQAMTIEPVHGLIADNLQGDVESELEKTVTDVPVVEPEPAPVSELEPLVSESSVVDSPVVEEKQEGQAEEQEEEEKEEASLSNKELYFTKTALKKQERQHAKSVKNITSDHQIVEKYLSKDFIKGLVTQLGAEEFGLNEFIAANLNDIKLNKQYELSSGPKMNLAKYAAVEWAGLFQGKNEIGDKLNKELLPSCSAFVENFSGLYEGSLDDATHMPLVYAGELNDLVLDLARYSLCRSVNSARDAREFIRSVVQES